MGSPLVTTSVAWLSLRSRNSMMCNSWRIHRNVYREMVKEIASQSPPPYKGKYPGYPATGGTGFERTAWEDRWLDLLQDTKSPTVKVKKKPFWYFEIPPDPAYLVLIKLLNKSIFTKLMGTSERVKFHHNEVLFLLKTELHRRPFDKFESVVIIWLSLASIRCQHHCTKSFLNLTTWKLGNRRQIKRLYVVWGMNSDLLNRLYFTPKVQSQLEHKRGCRQFRRSCQFHVQRQKVPGIPRSPRKSVVMLQVFMN